MIDNIPAAVLPPDVAAAQAVTPPLELSPVGESSIPAPTVEQAQIADRVFTAPTQPHPAASLLGVVTSALLLRDLAVDSFDTRDPEEESEEKRDEDKDADRID